MGATVSTTDLDGLFKVVYGSDIKVLMPETSKLVQAVGFSKEERIGDHFEQPVALTFEHGYTYAAPASGAFTLRASVAMKTKKATVDGYQGVLRSQMDYETAAKAVSGGDRAFRKATQLQVENMMDSATKRIELQILYGQKGIGQTSTSSNQSSTSTIVTISTATWASGIWAGMENCALNFFRSDTSALVSSSTDAVFTVSSVDVDNKKLTLSGSAAGITALDSAAGAVALDIFFDTARTDATTFNEFAGFDKIINNTGTIFNINATTYQLWKGNTYSAGSAALTLGKIVNGLASPIGRGGLNEKVTVYLNDKTWANVASDQAALRRYAADYRNEAENGFQYIRFYSANGEVELIPYNAVKEGEAYAIPLKRCKRIGAQDISFDSPGREGKIFRELTDSAGFEYRLYSDMALFCESPAKLLKFTNIVNQ